MKPHIIKMIAALLLGCALCPGRSLGQEYVKTSARPFEFRELTELRSDKDWKKRMTATKKEHKYKEVRPVQLPDGRPGMFCLTAAGTYVLRDGDGKYSYGGFGMTETNIETIDGKEYVQLLCKPEAKAALYTMDGRAILNEGYTYGVLRAGSHIIFWRPFYNEFFNEQGKSVFFGGSSDDTPSIHYTPEVKPGIKTVTVNGETMDMVCSATPEFLYFNHTVSGKEVAYMAAKDFEGNDMFSGLTWNMRPFPSPETGYYMKDVQQDNLFEVKVVNREVGGEVIPYRCLALKNSRIYGDLLDCHGNIVSWATDMAYSSPDHSITYRQSVNGRLLKGAIFVRDTTLNVPPLFADVMYKFDEESGAWKPYVRRSLFGPSEPYTPGMDTTPDFLNTVERDIEHGKVNTYELAERYGEGHKWSERDLAYVNYLFEQEVNAQQSLSGYKPESTFSLSEVARQGKDFIRYAEEGVFLHHHNSVLRVYQQALASNTGKEARNLAEQLISLTEKRKQEAQEWIDRQTELYTFVIEQSEKNAAEEAAREAASRKQSSQAPVAVAARRKSQDTDNATSLLILNAVMRGVSNTLSNIRGGNRLRVTYTGGNNGGFTAAPVGGGSGGTSSGSPVNAAEKCGRCGGTGSCSACHGHPGKATSAKDSPVCHGCGGTGRCPYCTNGYKR